MQLVELQRTVTTHDAAVVAISYDPVPVLAEFAQLHGITYPLLSDPGSVAITQLGLINHMIDADLEYWGTEKQEKHKLLPFPGVFVLDANGVVVSKHFERSHRNRASASFLSSTLGDSAAAGPSVSDEAVLPGMAVRASIRQPQVFPNQRFTIDVEFAVEEGMHVYVAPTPAGYQQLELSLNGPDGLFWDHPSLPTGEAFEIPALGEVFRVAEGRFETQIVTHAHESLSDVSIEVVIRAQACDETSCELPSEARLHLPLLVLPKM